MLSFSLDLIVHAPGVIRPVEREAVADKPLAKVSAIHGASRDSAPVLIQRDRGAANRLATDEGIEIIRCLGAASILEAIFASAKLRAFGCIDTPEPNTRAVYFQGVPIDNASLPQQVVGQGRSARGDKDEPDERPLRPSRKSMAQSY